MCPGQKLRSGIIGLALIIAQIEGMDSPRGHKMSIEFTIDPRMEKADVKGHSSVVVCYLGSWATYRNGEGAFDLLTHFDPNLCTHLIYSFAGLDNETNLIRVMDPYLDLEDDYGKGWYNKATSLRNKYPHLKVLLAIGGWNEGSLKYSTMVANEHLRKRFVQSAVDLIRKFGFDGLDFDWEFPTERGGAPEDRRLFTILMQELRTEFDRFGLMLTAAFSASKVIASAAYELPQLSNLLDHFHLMCYDFHGAWDGRANHNAPIQGSSHSIENSVNYFLSAGVPADKLVLGVPFYGRTFLLKEPETLNATSQGLGGLGQATLPAGFQGPFTKEDGFLGYNEICRELSSNRGEWETFWDDEGQVPWMRQGVKWVSFDNPLSLQRKVKFAQKKGLKGLMVWSIDTDDFRGNCGPRNPLLKALNHELTRSDLPKSTGGSGTKIGGIGAIIIPTLVATVLTAGWASLYF